eukprot:Gb_30147 [translate_table: standard]
MAMAKPISNQEKKMVFFLETMLHFQGTKATLTVNIKTDNRDLQRQDLHGNGNNCSVGIDTGGNIRSLCKQGRLKEAFHNLQLMDYRGIRADTSTYASLLQGCLNNKALPEGKRVHAHMTERGFKPGIYLETTLVAMYAKCGSLVNARKVLDEMPKRNVVSWTTLIAAYARYGYDEEALTLFYQMQRTGIEPNEFTFASVLPACANLASLELGKEVHEEIIRSGFHSNVFVGSALVDMYVKCRSIKDAREVFDKMPDRNVVSWNAMITGYAQNGNVDAAFKLFQKMPAQDMVSWNAMIAGYAQNGYVNEALVFFQKMPDRDVVSWNTMIAGYAQNGLVDEAMKLFQKMREPDVFSWNMMIAGYAQNGHIEKALDLFRRMRLTDVIPDSDSFTAVLPVSAHLAALEHGKAVHEDIIRNGFQSDVFVGSALIDMYAKCGRIDKARKIFNRMQRRNVVSWTAMIVGYAMHGCGKEALKLFEQMQHSGTNPDHVTFVGVLSACRHAGLVDDGWQYFNRMSRDYQITPAVQHYCCMVDLLGRAGRLDEAHDFINKMPIKPDAAVWGSLLGSCRIHNNIELGEFAAKQLFELDPNNAAHYVLLSNLYAAAGRWDDVEKVRKIMKGRQVERKPGCSWIEVNNKVYAFLVGDRSHPQAHDIYAKLDRLSGQTKKAGDVPNTRFTLHDVEDEQKMHTLYHHSENLAIAFGLINMSPRTPIQIIKNLQCVW